MNGDLKTAPETFKDYYIGILAYIQSHEPSTRETLQFIGALIHSTVDMINITQKEKELYINIYNLLISKKLSIKKTKDI